MALLIVLFVLRSKETAVPSDTTPSATDITSDNDGIKDAFEKYVRETSIGEIAGRAKYFQLTDNQDKTIPLDRFSDRIGLTINPSLSEIINNTDYSLFYCLQDGKKDYGIVLKTGASLDHASNNFARMAKITQEWEPTMFLDTKSVIFPDATNTNFVSLNTNVEFKDGAFRYADINMPDGSKKSINYYITSDSVFISSSKECLYKTFPDTEALRP